MVIALIFLYPAYKLLIGGRPEIAQTDQPLRREQAGRCPIPVPSDAKNIYFASYADLPAYQVFVRMELPFDEAMRFAEERLKEYENKSGRHLDLNPRPVTSEPELGLEPLPGLNLRWFDIQNIHNGLLFGDINTGPRAWVDKERNLFYYCESD